MSYNGFSADPIANVFCDVPDTVSLPKKKGKRRGHTSHHAANLTLVPFTDYDGYHNGEGKDQGHRDAQEHSKQYLRGRGHPGRGGWVLCTYPVGLESAELTTCAFSVTSQNNARDPINGDH